MVSISTNNTEELTKKIKDYTYNLDIDTVGIADIDNKLFLEAPDNHQPKNILKDAKSVIILGKTLPRSIFRLNNHQKILIHRVYHSTYNFLDVAAVRLSDYLETMGYYSISIPSYIPLAIENLEPWGVISLKHAGLAAGLGRIAKNGLLIHPEFGTLLRLSGVITTAKLIPDKMLEKDICRDCNLCIEHCPVKALKKSGKFSKIKCLNNVVKHGVNILHPYGENYIKNIELITNTMLLEYSLGCVKCLEVCPLNKKH
ncbi:MAG: 4Fe-4S double cluster binding domain-containing protein [Candidatus Helarchaeota archaeon]